jgi:hypothetical protein
MTKRIAIIAITAAGLLLAEQGAAPAASPIPSPRQVATSACKAQKSKLGSKGFKKRYGAHGMKACVRKQLGPARQAIADSKTECDDELAIEGLTEFTDSWSDDDGTGAYENCVLDGVLPDLDDDEDLEDEV